MLGFIEEVSERRHVGDVIPKMSKEGIAQCSAPITHSTLPLSTLESSAWEVAFSPIRSGGVNFAVMYFSSGPHPGIFQIAMMLYSVVGQVKALKNVGKMFEKIEKEIKGYEYDGSFWSSPMKSQRLAYMLACLLGLIYVGYLASTQGILPFKRSDYLNLIQKLQVTEIVGSVL